MAQSTASPIDVHTWSTPNGWKIPIMLEECGLPYRIVPVNIGKGEQMAPDFLAISPNNKIPAIVDPDGPGGEPISIFESGAILQYLGRKTGRVYPGDAPPTTPSWGILIAEGRGYIREAAWLTAIPGLAIAITVLGLNLLGDGLRDVLDPRLNLDSAR